MVLYRWAAASALPASDERRDGSCELEPLGEDFGFMEETAASLASGAWRAGNSVAQEDLSDEVPVQSQFELYDADHGMDS